MPKDGDDEGEAFARAMRDVRPLPEKAARVVGTPGKGTPSPRTASPDPFIVERTADTVAGRANDVSTQLLRELRGGKRPIEARIDLHGRVRAEAVRGLKRFVTEARARAFRVGLIIHGRGLGSAAGDPILRPAVWDWLSSPAAHRAGVMAFASARPADGGSGATLVLLRRG